MGKENQSKKTNDSTLDCITTRGMLLSMWWPIGAHESQVVVALT